MFVVHSKFYCFDFGIHELWNFMHLFGWWNFVHFHCRVMRWPVRLLRILWIAWTGKYRRWKLDKKKQFLLFGCAKKWNESKKKTIRWDPKKKNSSHFWRDYYYLWEGEFFILSQIYFFILLIRLYYHY